MKSIKERLKVGDYVLAKSRQELNQLAAEKGWTVLSTKTMQHIAGNILKVSMVADDNINVESVDRPDKFLIALYWEEIR